MTHWTVLHGSAWFLPSVRLAALARLLPLFVLLKFPSEPGRYEPGGDEDGPREPLADDLVRDLALRFWDRIRVFAARRLRDREAAEDVAQEALRRVLVALRENRVQNTAALPGFVFETARNLCLHRVRSAVRESRALGRLGSDDVAGESSGTLTRLIDEERRLEVRRALERLDAADREILLMHYEEQLPAEAIGSRLGITPAAARVRKHRALQRLGQLLGRPSAGNVLPGEGT